MANTISSLIAPIYEALNQVSREFVGFIPAVTRDNGAFGRAAIGQTVTSFIVPTVTASDIVPGVTAPNDGDQVLSGINLTISKSRYVPIRWNGEEQLALNNAGPGFNPILSAQFQQAFRTLVNEVETDIGVAAYKAGSRATGTAATTPFGTAGDLSDFANAAQILDENGAPMGTRAMVVNSAAMANIRGKQNVLFKVNEAGTDDLLRRGTIGAVEGFRLGYSPGIKPVTKGTGTGYLANGAAAVGATSLTVDTGTGTVLPGDIVTWAGDPNKYVVVTGGSAATNVTIEKPGLKLALADNTAMTIGGSYTPNVAFTQDALVVATRMPALPINLDGTRGDMGDHTMILDQFSGIAFDVGVYTQYRQIKFEVGLAWGVAAVNPEHIAILLG